MTAQEVVKFAQKNNCEMVDYKFLDFVGIWQHFSTPMSEFSEDIFEEGVGFDGSSIRGWQPIHNSDMLIIPDATTAKIDPFVKVPTLSLICNIIDPLTKEGYSRDRVWDHCLEQDELERRGEQVVRERQRAPGRPVDVRVPEVGEAQADLVGAPLEDPQVEERVVGVRGDAVLPDLPDRLQVEQCQHGVKHRRERQPAHRLPLHGAAEYPCPLSAG